MITLNTTIKNLRILTFLLLTLPVCLVSCKEEDPFVDRTVAPVLIVFDDVPGYLAGGGLTATPAITKEVNASNYTEPVVLSLTLYELDKSGILDHTVGIDSIPVSGVAITFSKKDGSSATDAITGADGKAAVTTTWSALGITDEQMTTIINSTSLQTRTFDVVWKGSYKGQNFTRFAQVVLRKPA